MSDELMLIDVKPHVPVRPLDAHRQKLDHLLKDLREKLNEAVEDEDMDEDTADEVMATMEDDGDFSQAWHSTLDDWKDAAWDWPGRTAFGCELKDLLSEVESAFYSLRRAERAEVEVVKRWE